MKLIPAALPQTQAAPAGPSLEDIQAKRQIAALLAKEGQSTAPVQHWTQAAARIAQAMMGSLNQSQAASEDSRLRGEANDAIMGLLPSLTGGASPAGMPPQPVKNDAQDAIDMTPDQKGVYQVAQGLASPGFQAAVQARQPQIDPNLVAGVKGFEGYSAKAYPDGRQTSIGYGTRATSPNEVIDQAEADRRLNSELGKAQGIVQAFAPNAPPGVQNALTSLTYNAGDKWTRSGLGALVKAGDYQGAQQRLLQYNKAGGVTNQGLVNRRQQEAQWMNGQPQQPQGVQVADASGGMDRAALAKMLANPYTKDFAEKMIMQRMKQPDPVSPLDQAKINYYNAQTQKAQQTQTKPVFTPGETAVDKSWAKTYEEDIVSGKLSDALSQLQTLRSVANGLTGPDASNVSGPLLGMVPEGIRAYTNPKSVDIQNQIANIVQRSLRPILGAQFTEKEGENLIKRAYNPQLDEATNAKRLKRLADVAEAMAKQKLAAAQYFEQNGTLKGFRGSANFSLADVENAIDQSDGGASNAYKSKYGLE